MNVELNSGDQCSFFSHFFFPLKARAHFNTPLWGFMVPLNGPEYQIANTENVNPVCLIWSLKYSCDVRK